MSVNKKEKSLKQPFSLATDEGDVFSEDVAAIIDERKADGGKYKGQIVTALRTKAQKVEGSNAHMPYVLASIGTVRALFRDHGYELPDHKSFSEDDLKELDARQQASPSP